MKTKNRFKVLALTLILFGCSFVCYAQQIDSLFATLEENYPQEKIHLHLDKQFYNPGETVWFKAYIIADNSPAAFSKTCYADLINEKGTILQRKMMPIFESGAASNFDLPDTLPGNKFFIRAYTSWMLNFDSSLLCLQPVNIIPIQPLVNRLTEMPVYTLSIFPEGGDLVENVQSIVAFKATNQHGRPVDVGGDIVNQNGKTVTSFISVHDGMGYFSLTPKANESYKAVWKNKQAEQQITALPAAKHNGVVLTVNYTDGELLYSLTRPDSLPTSSGVYYVIAQMQQSRIYSAAIKLVKKVTITTTISTDSVASGVLQLTVFNEAKMPVAERIVFIDNHNHFFKTTISAIEKNLDKRAKNVLQVDVGDTLLSNLSVAVTDDGVNVVNDNQENIYSQLLLSSDVKGYVYNAAQYFSTDGDSTKRMLDLVMMTNGWRRFKWENVLAAKWPVISFPVQNYISLNGKVQGLSKLQLKGKSLTGILKLQNEPNSFFNIPLNETGHFNIDNLYFFDTARLFYQLNNEKGKNITTSASFSFDNIFTSPPKKLLSPVSSMSFPEKQDTATLLKSSSLASLQRDQNAKNKIKTLTTVVVTAKQKSLKQKTNEEYASGLFSGEDAYIFTTEDDPFSISAPSVLQYLQGKVAGLQINTFGDGSASWRGSPTGLFLNEMRIDGQSLHGVSMTDVAMIKVFRPPFFGSVGGGPGGAIAVYTKKGAAAMAAIKGLDFTDIIGYSTIKEFYMPNYELANNPAIADYRTTLFWAPFILLDKTNRRITIPFYNSDNCKKLRVIIEGINELGQLTREEKIFQ